VEFLDHVEQKYGFEAVDHIIEGLDGQLKTAGAYTAVGNYPHEELLAMAVALTSLSDKDMSAVIAEFADHLMGAFQRLHPDYFSNQRDVFEFLLSVEHVIHVDVQKLYPDAKTPLIQGAIADDGSLILKYSSHRPLAQLALALTEASGRVFRQPLKIEVLESAADGRSATMKLRKLA
jgi:hypothetical protein